MSRHAKPVIVRLWLNGYDGESINAVVRDWDRGRFTLEHDHPMVAPAKDAARRPGSHSLTVLDTDELEWHIRSVTWRRCCPVEFDCIPRAAYLRTLLWTDEWLLEQGLAS